LKEDVDAIGVVRELARALNEADFDRAAKILDPEVVHHGTLGGIDQDRVVRGRDAVLEYWDEVGEAWASLRFEPERLIARGDVVVVFWRETARTRHSDFKIETQTAAIFRIRDGRIFELRGYLDRDEALRAAGISEG
jgi:ketosteroid isomerase-like protein